MDKQLIKGKRRARKLALQALYQWHLSQHEIIEIERQFRAANKLDKVDSTYFCRLLNGVIKQIETIEASFSPFLDREIQSLNPIELTILRLSAFELLFCPEIPYRVVLDEAVSLSKEFGSQEGHRYVNGVLHHLALQCRSVEVNTLHE